MIPNEKQMAVARALQAAFGTEVYDSIEPLTRGLSSAQVYRLVLQGKPYLLRVILRTDAIADPTRQFACMEAAAAEGIAPRVLYASVEDRVMISEFVEEQPFPQDMASRMAKALRALHALPAFPKIFTYLDVMDGTVQRLLSSGLVPNEQLELLRSGYDQMKAAYPRHADDQISCHNDLKPDNVLFDGTQLWLVDWEAAFLNDRYTELAMVANFYVEEGEAAERQYLRTYFGQEPGEQRLAQFFVMRQYMSVIYAAYFLTAAVSAGATVDATMELPGFKAYHRRLVAFELHMLQPQNQVEYGLLHLRHALEQMQTQRWAQSMTAMVDAS